MRIQYNLYSQLSVKECLYMFIWYCCNFHSSTRWKLYYTEWTLTVFMVVWVTILSNEKAQRFYLSNIIFKWQTPSCVKLMNNWRPNNKIPAFYKCYVDETLSTMPDVETAALFLSTLNNSHPSIDFRMELEENRQLRFLGMEIIRSGCWLDMKVYRKPMDTGLLLHYHSHMDGRQRSLLIDPRRYTNMEAGNQRKHLELTFAMKAFSFHSWSTTIHVRKHIS